MVRRADHLREINLCCAERQGYIDCVYPQIPCLMESDSSEISSNGNALVLYHYCTSYYSQKVVMAFQEKRLKYKSHQVNLFKYEQYEPWFMRLNPNGQVPVLKDGIKIIPGSARIIDYLEDNFSNGDTPRLLPEKGTLQANRVQVLKELLDKVPIEIITLGCTRFQELTTGSLLIPCVRKMILGCLHFNTSLFK